MTAIWWVRRDLRLHDNAALMAAADAGPVVPVFVLDPAVLRSRSHRAAERRRAFLSEGLRALDQRLRAAGSRLILRRGDPVEALTALARESGASRIIAVEDASPAAVRRDARVAQALPLTLVPGIASRPLGDLVRLDGAPHRTFRGFRLAWLRSSAPAPAALHPAPRVLPGVPDHLGSAVVPEATTPAGAFPAGEDEALRRLRRFMDGADAPVRRYHVDRDRPAVEGTSALSPYLHFGMLSPRLAVTQATRLVAAGCEGAASWLDELVWREYYLALLRSGAAPESGDMEPRWINDPADIRAWQQGETGYPLVDAGMRQLRDTGWMHNRVRMVAASFLVKHLLCDWRIGEQWFMDHLVDGDPAANRGGWRWVGGIGVDAAPYFRVMNPVAQARRFDPDGAYVRRWVPELRAIDTSEVFEPWGRPAGPPPGYPAPVIALAEGRARALVAYREARGQTATRGGAGLRSTGLRATGRGGS